jgi:hypothetical protein
MEEGEEPSREGRRSTPLLERERSDGVEESGARLEREE